MKEYIDPTAESHSRFANAYDAERSDMYDDADPFGREENHQVRLSTSNHNSN
jgi:hypothetical protein